MQVLRAYHSIRRTVMRFCCGDKPRYAVSYTIHGYEPSTSIVPRGSIILETVKRSIVDETDIRTRVHYPGAEYTTSADAQSFFAEKPDLPWMWIGGTDRHGETHTRTEDMSQFILPGNRISLSLLRVQHPEIVHWKYMCPLTFEEVDFPADGITI